MCFKCIQYALIHILNILILVYLFLIILCYSTILKRLFLARDTYVYIFTLFKYP